jgi:hypothetical protein
MKHVFSALEFSCLLLVLLKKKKIVNMQIKLCNLVPNHIKEMNQCKLFQREFEINLSQHEFYVVEKGMPRCTLAYK